MISGASAKFTDHKSREKTRTCNLQYRPRNKVSKIFIISLRLIRHVERKQLSNLAGCMVKNGC